MSFQITAFIILQNEPVDKTEKERDTRHALKYYCLEKIIVSLCPLAHIVGIILYICGLSRTTVYKYIGLLEG